MLMMLELSNNHDDLPCGEEAVEDYQKMTMRLSGSLKRASRLYVNTIVRPPATRHFACTVLLSKDIASEEDIPNLRHAPRPRTSS